jgi:hypothetical protein
MWKLLVMSASNCQSYHASNASTDTPLFRHVERGVLTEGALLQRPSLLTLQFLISTLTCSAVVDVAIGSAPCTVPFVVPRVLARSDMESCLP